MSTLFFVVAKKLICRVLDAKVADSKAKEDQKILGLLPVPLNKALAETKRNYLVALSTTISQLDDLESDLAAAKKLLEALTESRARTSSAALESSQSLSATEAMLDRLKAFVTTFYDKLKRLKLLNQPEEEGAFYLFLATMSSYHADRIFENSATPSFFANPNITCINQYHKVIDDLVDERLRIALENLKGQQTGDPQYSQRKNDLGTLNIEFMILKNREIRMHYSMTITHALAWLPSTLDSHLGSAELAVASRSSSTLGAAVDPDIIALEEDDLVSEVK